MSTSKVYLAQKSHKSSLMLHQITLQAHSDSQERISSQFMDPTSLENISLMRQRVQKQLAMADAQLNNAITTKLDVLKRGIDISSDSNEKLKEIAKVLQTTESRIFSTNTDISEHEFLRRLHFAKQNIKKTRTLVEFFANVPETVKDLQLLLESSPDQLKRVYLESVRLEALRDGLYKETKRILNESESHNIYDNSVTSSDDVSSSVTSPYALANRRKSITDMKVKQSINNNSSSSSSSFSQSDSCFKIQKVLDEQLSIVPELSKQIRSVLWSNIARLFDVGTVAPANIVETFEVLEMHGEYVHRRLEQNNSSTSSSFVSSEFLIDLFPEAKQRLEQYLIDKIESSLVILEEIHATVETAAALEQQNAYNDNDNDNDEDNDFDDEKEKDSMKKSAEQLAEKLAITLRSCNEILQILTIFKNEIAPCIPPRYEILRFFIANIEMKIQPLIEDVTKENLASYEVSELLILIDWMVYYEAQMELYDTNFGKCFEDLRSELMHEYLHRIKHQVLGWFDNIKMLNSEQAQFSKNRRGHLVTSTPGDMFNVVRVQIDVAREKLPAEHLQEVINACVQVLREVQRNMYDGLVNDWRKMYCEALVACINDFGKLHENCDAFVREIEEMVPQENYRNMLVHSLEELGSEFISLSITSVNFLARRIMEDLKEDVFDFLFSPSWEDGGQPLGAIIVKTLEDYFADIVEWLPQYFFRKFCIEMMHVVSMEYVAALDKRQAEFKTTAAGKKKEFQLQSNNLAVAARVLKDFEDICEFFDKYEDNLRNVEIRSEVAPMRNLVNLFSAAHPSGVVDQIKAMFERWSIKHDTEQGLRIVQTALSCSVAMNPHECTANREYVIGLYQHFRSEVEGESKGNGTRSTEAMMKAYESTPSTKKTSKRASFTSMFGLKDA